MWQWIRVPDIIQPQAVRATAVMQSISELRLPRREFTASAQYTNSVAESLSCGRLNVYVNFGFYG